MLVLQLGSVATDVYQAQPRYVCPPYAELDRAQRAGFAAHQSWRAAPEQVAATIADAIEAADSPLRVPVGQDAAWLLAERARLDDTAWSARVRELLGLDGAA
ncbi:MAG: hypothetical protein ACRDYX_13075 [Egibacteraceae bacterium]